MIHKFSLNGYNIVLDVYSGAVHVLDDIAFKAVEYIENFSEDKALSMLAGEFNKEDAGEVLTEVKQLIVQGLLFSEDPYKEYSKIESKSYIVKSLCLNIAHDCNLRCEYCFASKGDFGGSRSLMSYEIASKAIDFLLVNSGNRKNLEVDFELKLIYCLQYRRFPYHKIQNQLREFQSFGFVFHYRASFQGLNA